MKPFQSLRTIPLLLTAVVVLAVLNVALLGVVWTRLATEPTPVASADPTLNAWLLDLRQEMERGDWTPERRAALLERLREMEAGRARGGPPFDRDRPAFDDEMPDPRFRRPGGPGRSGLPDAAGTAFRGLDRRLGLDSLQLQQIRTLRSRHLQQTRTLESAVRRQRLELLEGRLQAEQRGAVLSDAYLAEQTARYDSVAAQLIRLERLNLQHIQDIRALLDENQQNLFDRNLTRMFSSP